jgi:hypothetical protein
MLSAWHRRNRREILRCAQDDGQVQIAIKYEEATPDRAAPEKENDEAIR